MTEWECLLKGSENVITISKKALNVVWKGIHVHIKDHVLLKMYRVKHKISMTGVLHMLIGAVRMCLEEKHLQRIAFLERQVSHLAGIAIAYKDKYGKLPPVSSQSTANKGEHHA